MLQYKATVPQSLHMARQDRVKLIQWLESKNYLQKKYTKVIRDKV